MLSSILPAQLLAQPRQIALQALNFALVISTAFMVWKGLSVATNSPSPIVVVLSGSMEPAFQRGDILFLWNRDWSLLQSVTGLLGGVGSVAGMSEDGTGEAWDLERRMSGSVGEIVVYNVRGKDIPIVHRVVRSFGGGAIPHQILTKGDNNLADDTELYARGQDYLDRDVDVIGSVIAYIPFVGYVTILLSEHPWLKTVMMGMMGVMVVLQRE
ncbi:Signal peptidase complex catalytic subunit [Agyrium rufum]|nr:Signal peptidase complex catalytic subunit [Agyrium rufum]